MIKQVFYLVNCCSVFLFLNCKNQSDSIFMSASSGSEHTSGLHSDPKLDSLIDERDGQKYLTIEIGDNVWLAQNLNFDSPGSMLNSENPSSAYGRLYTIEAKQNACPIGWRLPSDLDWDKLEMTHGMASDFLAKGGWRGEHADNLKSKKDWDVNGKDIYGFNVLPAGYYFSGQMGGEKGMQGLGFSAAFWSSTVEGITYARFLFGVRQFVNKWEDVNGDSGAALSCRCVKSRTI